ncbi:MAG TPA: HD domain-containing protein [Candidatus Paceibacterota bacterium]|nr:HD domain-containing protein [Candidatus Paceibacterota bacterium]HMO83064.1 HD domain-containing protein [Candidatus Paceibacterota bacterium]
MITLADYTPEFIMEELKKLQYLYGLKQEIRYAQRRTQEDSTESVAEHIYGMHICAQYFLPLENPEGTWDRTRIYEMITLHDIDEIETGDVLGYLKDEARKIVEADAMLVVKQKIPTHMRASMTALIDEYESQVSPESRFVKAIDKIEPVVECYHEKYKAIFAKNKSTVENWRSIKDKYVENYPYIKIFSETVCQTMVKDGFFYQG